MGDSIWRSEYSVGDDHLDAQHRGLIDLIDMLDDESRMAEVLGRLTVSRRAFREPEVALMLRDSTRAYLKSWLVNHIMLSDKDYASWLD